MWKGELYIESRESMEDFFGTSELLTAEEKDKARKVVDEADTVNWPVEIVFEIEEDTWEEFATTCRIPMTRDDPEHRYEVTVWEDGGTTSFFVKGDGFHSQADEQFLQVFFTDQDQAVFESVGNKVTIREDDP